MAPRSEEGGGGLSCWLCTRRACIAVGSAAVLSSVVYVLYRYYRSRRDSDLSKDEGFEDTTKVCMIAELAPDLATDTPVADQTRILVQNPRDQPA